MKRILVLLFIVTILYCKDKCNQFSKDYIPKNLEETFLYFDCNWSDTMKEDFKNKSEDELVLLHHGFGTSLRNKWNLWKGNNDLSNYFIKIGISHPDDMSGIIINSYHRKLNNKPFNLKKQVTKHQEHWNNSKWNNGNEKENDDDDTDF